MVALHLGISLKPRGISDWAPRMRWHFRSVCVPRPHWEDRDNQLLPLEHIVGKQTNKNH